MNSRNFRCMSLAMVLGASGCMLGEADLAETHVAGDAGDSATETAVDVESTRIALQTGVSAEPGDNDGFCEDGAGVFLSAIGDAAHLTLYVVAPAEMVTFERSSLQLTTQQADGEATEVSDFEPVTLEAGESWSFAEDADGPLMDVIAEVDARIVHVNQPSGPD
jgi:hypothetical protein